MSFLGKSFANISQDRSSGVGLLGSLFGKNGLGISQSDLSLLGDALDLVKDGTLSAESAMSMLADRSQEVQDLFVKYNEAGKGSEALAAGLRSAGAASKAASIGMAALNMALSALTAMAIQLAIQAAIKGLDQLVNGAHNAAVAMKETAEKSIETANKSAKDVDSLDELISKYEEVAKSGLKDAESRAQVRDIQNEINGLVGSEAGKIDLVNGSYKEQLGILQQIRAENSKEALRSSYVAYAYAKKAADNVTGEQDGGFFSGKGYDYVGKYDPELVRALVNAGYTKPGQDEEGFITRYGFLGGNIGLRANYDKNNNVISGAEANIKAIDEVLQVLEDAGLRSHEAYSALDKQRSKFQDQLNTKNQQLDALLGQVVDTYRDFEAESKGIGGDTADAFREYYTDIINGVFGDELLQEAIESSDLSYQHITDAVLSTLATSHGLSKGYSLFDRQRRTDSILNGLDVSTKGRVSDDLIAYINSLSDEDLSILLPIAIDPNSRLETKEQVEAAIENAKNIPEVQKLSFKDFYSGDTIKETFDPILKRFNDAQSAITALENGTSTVEDLLVEHPEWSDFGGVDMQTYLKKYAADAKKAAEEAYAEARKGIAEEDLAAYDEYVKAVMQQYETPETLTIGIDIDVETKNMDSVISSIKSSVSQLGLNNEQIAQLQSRYKDIAGYFPDKLFERTTNGIHLNTDALMKLESAYEDQKKLDMQTNLEDLQREYASLTTEINRADAAGGDTTGLYKQRSAIEAQINALTVAQSQFEALTSTYNKWKQAQSMGEEGDMYDDIQSNLKNIKELYDDGLIGTNKFKSAIELMTGKDAYGMSSDELIAVYDEAYPKMERYFAEGAKGSETFLEDLERIGAATKNGDQWSFDFNAEEIAKQLGVSADLVEIMVRKLADYNFDVDLSSFGSGIQQYATDIDTAVGEIAHSKEELTKSFESGQISTKEYVDAWKALDQYEKDLQQIRSGATPVEADTMSLDEAKEKINELSGAIKGLVSTGIEIPVILTGQYDELKKFVEDKEHSWSEWNFGAEGTTTADGRTGGNAGYWNRAVTVNQMLETAMQSQENAASVMQSFFGKGGSVDLLNRPVITSDKLADMGYDTVRGEIATLFSHSASIGENGEIGVVLTPILPNGDVLEAGTMDAVLKDIFLGSDGKAHLPDGDWGFNLEDILVSQIDTTEIPEHLRGQFIDFFANSLHKAQEYFYAGQEPIDVAAEVKPSNVDTTGMFQDMPIVIDEPLEADVEVKAKEVDTTGMFQDMPTIVDEPIDADIDANLADDWQSAFDEQLRKADPLDVPVKPSTDNTFVEDMQEEFDDQSPMIEFNFDPQVEPKSVDEIAADVQSEFDDNPIDITARTLLDAQSDVSGSGGGFDLINIARDAGIAKQEVTAMEAAYHDLSVAVNNVKGIDPGDTASLQDASSGLSDAAANYMAAYNNLAAKVGELQTVNVDANTQSALSKIDALANKTVTVTVYARTIGFPASTVTGNADATGTAYAGGSAFRNGVGHVKGDGIALGGELGAETIVRNGKWFTIGDNGAEFFRYKDGDIIFNASQTEELLRTGKIRSGGGRGIVFGNDSAYAEGTAFVLNTNKMLTESGDVGVKGSGSIISSKTTTSSKNSKKKSKSKTSSKDKTPADASDLFDWIEVAIERVERAISNLARTATSTFKTLASRLTASNDEITKVYEEIATQQAGAARYMQEANSVELSDDLKALVQNGAIDISKYDDKTQELINSYKEWYDKSLACSDAVDELHESLGKLYEDRFNDINQNFDDQLSMLEHLTNSYSNSLDLIEESGYLGGQSLYANLQAVEQQNISVRQQQLAQLTQAMSDAVNSGEIKEYSESWYEMQGSINAVKESIQDAELAVVKYGNSMRQLNWDIFDYQLERISGITEEADFLVDLMNSSKLFDDKGQFTGTGKAQLGLAAVNYDVYMAQADKYAEEVKRLNAEISNDPYDTELIKRRDELLKLQRESIQSAEQEKEAVADLVEQGINLELDALKELIETYEDSLDSAKDLYSYQKKVAKQTEEIASIEKQLSAYSGDNSEENRARVQKLQVELKEANESLEETQYDQYIKDQKQLFDDLYDQYEQAMNERLDNVDALMDEMIEYTNQNAGEIRDKIAEEASAVGYTLTSEMSNIWAGSGNAYSVVSKYGDAINTSLTTVNAALGAIATNVAALVTNANAKAAEVSASTTATTATIAPPAKAPAKQEPAKTTPSEKMIEVVNGKWYLYKDKNGKKGKKTTTKVKPGELYKYLGEEDGYTKVLYEGKERWFNSKGVKKIGFSGGGFVADLQKVAYRNGDDMVTFNTLKRGEAIFTEAQYRQINKLVDSLPMIQGLVDTNSMLKPLANAGMSVASGDTTINLGGIQIDRVSDYNDFVRQLRDDKNFERMIGSMTLDKLVGKSDLGKKRYYA